jgi:hypothetical protein
MNRRAAIAAHCKACGDKVKDCPVTTCHLHPFKLPQVKQDPKEREKAIHRYCLWCMGDTTHSPDHVIDCQDVECTLHPYRFRDQRLRSVLRTTEGCSVLQPTLRKETNLPAGDFEVSLRSDGEVRPSSKHAPLVKSKAKKGHIDATFEKDIPEYGFSNVSSYMSKNGLKFDQGQVDLNLLGFICLFEVMIGFIINFPIFK